MFGYQKERREMVYDKVKALADERHISIMALEIKAGLKNGTVGKWRVSSPTLKNLQAVANALDVSVNDIIEASESTDEESV